MTADATRALSAPPPKAGRVIDPRMRNLEIWPDPGGYPWADSGIRCMTREAILRRTAPGRLICTWTTGGFTEPDAGNFTMAGRSADGGQTWTEPYVFFQHAQRGLFTTEVFVPRPGEVHAFLQTYTPHTSWVQLNSYRAISRDGGETWSAPHSIPGGVHNVWVNSGIVHSSGRWILPVSWAELAGGQWCEPTVGRPPVPPVAGGKPVLQLELPHGSDSWLHYTKSNEWAAANHRLCAGVMISDDDGATFRLHGYVRDEGANFIEPKVVERRDGSLVMLLRAFKAGGLWRSDSRDAGLTWSAPRRTDIPNPSSKFKLLRAADGRIVLLHNPNNTVGLQHRTPLSLWVSRDDMETWESKTDLVSDPEGLLNYPDGYLDEDAGEVHFAWEDAFRVYLARVPL